MKIVSALRPIGLQKRAFLNKYIKNGDPPACGPRAYRTQIYQAIGAPPGKDDQAYHAKVDQYLKDHPEVMSALDNVDNYENCPHVIGKAIDVQILDASGNQASHDYVREVMCRADWVNYGKEWWHYEYQTGLWKKSRPDQVPDNLIGSPSSNTYHKNCYYGKALV